MSKSIRCACGSLVHGGTDEELLANTEAHVAAAHADALSLLASSSLGRLRTAVEALDRRISVLERGEA